MRKFAVWRPTPWSRQRPDGSSSQFRACQHDALATNLRGHDGISQGTLSTLSLLIHIRDESLESLEDRESPKLQPMITALCARTPSKSCCKLRLISLTNEA